MQQKNPGFICGKYDDFKATLGARNGVPSRSYIFEMTTAPVQNSYTDAMLQACQGLGMKPVCDHPNYCKNDARSLYIGQDETLSHTDQRNTASYSPTGFAAVKDKWNGLCAFTGSDGGDQKTLCSYANGHAYYTMAQNNPGFICGKYDEFRATLGAKNGVPSRSYIFTKAIAPVQNSYTDAMIQACQGLGMKPVCDHKSYCQNDDRALYIGQSHHLAHVNQRLNYDQYFPSGFPAIKEKWNGLCAFTARERALCDHGARSHAWRYMRDNNPGFICGKY